jgi:hypothetical protein
LDPDRLPEVVARAGSTDQWIVGRRVKRVVSNVAPARSTRSVPPRVSTMSSATGRGVGATVRNTSSSPSAFASKFFSARKMSGPQYVAGGNDSCASTAWRSAPRPTEPRTRPPGTSIAKSTMGSPSVSRTIDRPVSATSVPATRASALSSSLEPSLKRATRTLDSTSP